MTTYNLFGTAAPSGATVRSDGPATVATEFYVISGAWLTAIRYYRPDTTTQSQTPNAQVWTVDSASAGTAITPIVTLAIGSTAGWKEVAVTPVRLTVGQRYRVGVNATRFPQANSYWVSGGPGASGITNGLLIAPNAAGAVGGAQSSFGAFGAANPTFPANGGGSGGSAGPGGCFFTDLVVDDADPTGLSQRMFAAAPLH